jgi:aspartokinase
MNKKEQGVIVQKYGGSSVANVEMLKLVARKIVETSEKGFGVVVVISAMGNQTNELLDLANEVSHQPRSRELDMLLSVGERIAMAILSMAINDLGKQAISFTGSQSGIITDSSHTRASIVEVKAQRIRHELDKGKIVIVAGYQGVSREKEITTLGRGGSDTTAIALAAALSAEHCEIYSDVDGIYTADPRVVDDAVKLDSLSYEEMEELSRSGAVVMKSTAVEYARKHGIKMSLMSTFRESSGTTVSEEPAPGGRPVLGLSFETSLIVLYGVDEHWGKRVRSEVIPRLVELGFVPRFVNKIAPEGGANSYFMGVFKNGGISEPPAALQKVEIEFPWIKGNARICGSVTVITLDMDPISLVNSETIDMLRGGGCDLLGYNITDRCCTFYLSADDVQTGLKLLHMKLLEN